MSHDIKKILARLDEALTPVSVKKGLNPQQRSVPQLPADFKPKTIRALGTPTDPRHPMAGMAVGAAESAGEEIEERCWTGYRQAGMKKKGDRQVPNCVKVTEREQQRQPPKTRNPVAKNAPRSGAGAHANKKRADRYGEVKHKKSATVNYELKEMQHRPEHAVMILRRIPEGYRGARLYEKIMNTIIKRLGPAGPTAERREFYQTLAADVMERYVQKYPASAEVREDRAQDIKMSDAIDTMINGYERHHEVKGPFADEESAREYAEQYLGEGVSEGRVMESGETYVWTAHFGDGSTEQLRIATDEVPYARAAFEKKFPNRSITKVNTDWRAQDDGYGAMPAARYTEPRPQPDNPMVREAWTLRGSKTRDNLEVKVYHDAERGRWALQMFVDGEYRPDQTQHFDSAQDAKEALRILMNFGLKESPAMKDLSEAIAEIEEDMLSKVRNDLTRYLDRLEKKVNKDRALQPKDDKTMDEDPTAVDTMSVPPPAPVQNPVMPESVAVKSIALEDGTILEIHGDQLRGFEVHRGGRSLPTRFPNLDHAQMAVDLYRRRRGASDPSADYVEER